MIEKQTYIKIIKKLNTERSLSISVFLKQLSLIKNWTQKEVALLFQQLQVKKYAVPGSLVIEEGQPSQNICIIKEGEFEVFKRKTTNVFMNAESGAVQINVSALKKIKTRCIAPQGPPKSKFGQNSLYLGTELQKRIQTYLSMQIKEDQPANELFRST